MIIHYESSLNKGFHQHKKTVEGLDTAFHLTFNDNKIFQQVVGFGGAFTEAASHTFSKMSDKNQAEILKAYFDQNEGLRYNLGRVAINSCDFALGHYTYVKDNDETLDSFNIEREHRWVIPMIKAAEKQRQSSLELLASPWSPPAWMKTNDTMSHGGELLPKYYPIWAEYYLKFIQAFNEAGLRIFGLTVQNEPAAKQIWDSCLYSAEQERDFVKYHLGPTLEKSEYKATKIIIWDHNRDILVERAKTVLEDTEAARYVWGVGVHWYVSEAFENLSKVHTMFPDKHLLFTEGCIEGGVKRNDFSTGERYARNMIGDFNHYLEGFIDWNLVLDETGGPNHVGNYCDAPIICDTIKKKVIKNSSYYAIGHFSKYIDVGAHRIASNLNHPHLNQVAFKNPNGDIVVIVQNETETPVDIRIGLDHMRKPYVRLSERSISTIILRGDRS